MTIKADFIVEMDYFFCLNFYSSFRSFDRCCCRENLGDRIMKRSKEKIGANVARARRFMRIGGECIPGVWYA